MSHEFRHQTVHALQGVDLRVPRGQIGLLGPLGAVLPISLSHVATNLVLGQDVAGPAWAAVPTTVLASALLVTAAVWRFNREEL